MIAIRPLRHLDPIRFQEIVSSYTTSEIYRVTHIESEQTTHFTLVLETLPEPRTFHFPFLESDFVRYRALFSGDFCFAAYDGETAVALAIAEPQPWNRVLSVWEFHVAVTHRGQGIGRRLMDALIEPARAAGLRALVCETQNTNVPAIRFYRAVGYALEGIDVSYYTNDDLLPGHTVAVFMKRRLE